MAVPADVQRYLDRLVDRLRQGLGPDLIGVYAVGGLALGDYRPASSDIDVYAVVRTALDETIKRSVADLCSHRRLPCPARRLELVVVSAAAAGSPGTTPRWELNLNTGEHETDHIGLDPAGEPSHWFVLDLALARQCALPLLGPSADELIGEPEDADVRAAQAQVVAWYAGNGLGPETVAAACRAWHWSETGTFAAKPDALRWAAERLGAGAHHWGEVPTSD
jgi:hypothetical protein